MALRGDQMNVLGPRMLVRDKTNNVSMGAGEMAEGVDDDGYVDALALDMSDVELLALARSWESSYKMYEGKIVQRQKANKQYYLGRQNQQQNALENAPVPSNLLFEASETFLAQALARNPDPVVYADNTPAGNEESQNVKTMLQALADTHVLRSKLRMMVRHWNIYFIGVLKHGWDGEIHEISTEVRNPKNFIFDPNGYVDVYGDFIGYVGERITQSARTLADMYPEFENYIGELVEFKWGTDVTWTEWWTDDYTFTTFKGRVLDKSRNPHFNYPQNLPEGAGEQVIETLKEGNNHFARPKKPYTFLSVFSFQEQPHDETSLIEQNMPQQNLITERIAQLAKNYRQSNNSIAFSEAAGFNQEKAKQAATGMEQGHPVLVPGDVRASVMRFPAPSYPAEAFEELKMNMDNLRAIYGTQGITAQQNDRETTARGMILNQQRDSTRIGGSIGDALNQIADTTFNWWVQLMRVYYDDAHRAAILGQLKSVEEATIEATSFNRKLMVSVSPDSMKPKDEITQMNQATQLFTEGSLDPKTYFAMINFPNAEETAESTVLWQLDKQQYLLRAFPELAAQLQQQAAAQPAPAGAPPPAAQGGGPVVSPIQQTELSAPAASANINQVPLPQIPQ